MKLPFKPHLLTLLCSAGLLAASGVLFVKSRATEPVAPAPVAQQPAAPAVAQPAPVVAPTYTAAQIDQWVAPIALYPDALLSQILMASTYPANVIQAAQWSKDNPKMEGDAAIQAVASQPWDPSVKSLVAFPQLMSLMGENPPWVQNLGDAFLAQPKDVMDSWLRSAAVMGDETCCNPLELMVKKGYDEIPMLAELLPIKDCCHSASSSRFTSKLVKDKNGEYRCSEGLSSEERGKYLDSEVTATIRQLIDSDDLFQKYIEGAIARSRGISIKCTQQ